MKKMELIKAVPDEALFSRLMFDLVSYCETRERLTELLSEELSEGGLEALKSLAGVK